MVIQKEQVRLCSAALIAASEMSRLGTDYIEFRSARKIVLISLVDVSDLPSLGLNSLRLYAQETYSEYTMPHDTPVPPTSPDSSATCSPSPNASDPRDRPIASSGLNE